MKSITPLDIVKGILFSIGLVVAYIAIGAISSALGRFFRYLFADASPLSIIIGLTIFFAIFGILSGFSVAVRFGFNVKDIFKLDSDKKKEE